MKKKFIFLTATLGLSFIMSGSVLAKDISINKKNFPDNDVRSYVKENFDRNKNNKISKKEISKAKVFELDKNQIVEKYENDYYEKTAKRKAFAAKKIKTAKTINCKGLNRFKNLESITIRTASTEESYFGKGTIKNINQINSLKKLESILIMNGKGIEKINVSKMKNLKELMILDVPKLKTLNLTSNKKLKYLLLNAPVSKINLKNNTNLKELYLVACPNLKDIYLNNNTKLTALSVVGCNGLTKLNVSKNINLEMLSVSYTRIKDIVFPENNNIKEFFGNVTNIDNDAMKTFDSKEVKEISIYGTKVKEIDITNFANLNKIGVSSDVNVIKGDNQITEVGNYSTRTVIEEDNAWLNNTNTVNLKKFVVPLLLDGTMK